MALFELEQEYAPAFTDDEWAGATFKDFATADIDDVFFNGNEHADTHLVDGKECLIILEEADAREHSAHWEGGSKQNFDTGIYTAHLIMYIKVADYGAKPKQGKQLVLDGGTSMQRTYSIIKCEDEGGVYRMTIERLRQ